MGSPAHLPEHRLVAEDDGDVIGWAALSAVSNRACYRGVAEESVYVRGAGAWTRRRSRAPLRTRRTGGLRPGIWTIQTSIFPENVVSLELHRRCGFRVVGTRERIGQLHGVWRDTVLLERRVA